MIKEQDILDIGFSKELTMTCNAIYENNVSWHRPIIFEDKENELNFAYDNLKVYEYKVYGEINWHDSMEHERAFSILIILNNLSGLLIIYHVVVPEWQIMYKKIFTGKISKLTPRSLRKVLNNTLCGKGKLFKQKRTIK